MVMLSRIYRQTPHQALIAATGSRYKACDGTAITARTSDPMLRWALRSAKTRKTSKVVVAALTPLIQGSRQRLSAFPENAWLDPYLLGFMAVLITALARADGPPLSDSELCAVQARVWGELTDMNADLFGEEVMLLADARDDWFFSGCRDAENVVALLPVTGLTRHNEMFELETNTQFEPFGSATKIWELTFDHRMIGLSADKFVVS